MLLNHVQRHEYAIDASFPRKSLLHANWPNSYYFHQLAVEDLPEAPTTVPAEIDEKLDLPDVPTKAPVISDAEVPIKRKGIASSLWTRPVPSLPMKTKEV
jgi:hypothetical protein